MELVCRLPFSENIKSKASRPPKGKFAHENSVLSKYAVDFPVPVGTPVLAVKKGVVILAKYDSDVHYSPESVEQMTKEEIENISEKYTNLVAINHGKGFFTEYGHLSKRKVVRLGQKVAEGNVIGYVGMTGITSEPHIHINAFTIDKRKGIVKSIPIRFV